MRELVQTNTLCHHSKEVNVFHLVIVSFHKSKSYQSCVRNQRLLLTLYFGHCSSIDIYFTVVDSWKEGRLPL